MSTQKATEPKQVLQDTIRCPTCSYENASWRSACESCRAPLRTGAPTMPIEKTRPGCLVLYITLGGLSAAGALFLSIMLLNEDLPLFGLLLFLLAGVDACLLIGLWQLKRWARTATIVLRGLSAFLCLLGSITGNFSLLAGVGVNAAIIGWFLNNEEYFYE